MATILYTFESPGEDGGTWYTLVYPAMSNGESSHGATRHFRTAEARQAAFERFDKAALEAGLFPLLIPAE